jgi:metal-sulfur cluster biosynthetic enzyme
MSLSIDEQVIEILKQCYDPEIPIDLWNLGLIYHIEIKEYENDLKNIHIIMSLTTPGCHMGKSMANDIKTKLEATNFVNNAKVDITFDPPWTPELMTDEAREKLGFSKPPENKVQTSWE